MDKKESIKNLTEEIFQITNSQSATIRISKWANGNTKRLQEMKERLSHNPTKPIDCHMADIVADEM